MSINETATLEYTGTATGPALDTEAGGGFRLPRLNARARRAAEAKPAFDDAAEARGQARISAEAPDKLTVRERFLTANNLLFVAFLATLALPAATVEDPQPLYAAVVALGIEAVVLVASALVKKRTTRNSVVDVSSVLFVALIAWQLCTAVFNLVPESMFSAPGTVFAQIAADRVKILTGIGASLTTVAQGYLAGAAVALIVGLGLGYHARTARSTEKVVAFLSAIPPVVYIPYGIALLPTFHDASVLVIFLATLWPTLTSTLAGVSGVDERVLDSAKVLNAGTFTTIFRVVLPASLPSIFNGLNIALCLSFILLTSAEMIAGNVGMGYYVNYYSSFGDFTRVLAGIIVIGVVITAVSLALAKLQKVLTRWK